MNAGRRNLCGAVWGLSSLGNHSKAALLVRSGQRVGVSRLFATTSEGKKLPDIPVKEIYRHRAVLNWEDMALPPAGHRRSEVLPPSSDIPLPAGEKDLHPPETIECLRGHFYAQLLNEPTPRKHRFPLFIRQRAEARDHILLKVPELCKEAFRDDTLVSPYLEHMVMVPISFCPSAGLQPLPEEIRAPESCLPWRALHAYFGDKHETLKNFRNRFRGTPTFPEAIAHIIKTYRSDRGLLPRAPISLYLPVNDFDHMFLPNADTVFERQKVGREVVRSVVHQEIQLHDNCLFFTAWAGTDKTDIDQVLREEFEELRQQMREDLERGVAAYEPFSQE